MYCWEYNNERDWLIDMVGIVPLIELLTVHQKSAIHNGGLNDLEYDPT